jgi:osmotically-inducible protein OsmY
MTKQLGAQVARVLVAGSLLLAPAAPAIYAAPQQNKQPTADNQSNHRPDVETTRQVRKALEADHSLSVAAHNVKVITKNGTVTLRGRVKSEDDRAAIKAKAEEIAGKGNVTDELTVAPSK